MRLIDADKEKKKYPWKDDVQYALRNAETVDAIPISWILNHPKMPKEGTKRDVILDMIEDWRKEEEAWHL